MEGLIASRANVVLKFEITTNRHQIIRDKIDL